MEPIAIGTALRNLKLADVAKLIAALGILLFGIGGLLLSLSWEPVSIHQMQSQDAADVVIDQPIEQPDIVVNVPSPCVSVNITDADSLYCNWPPGRK